jgi:RNA polymerase sigma-70 factor, ECF subfamily
MITFHDLYTRYAPDVTRFAYWLCGNEQEAEDIAQETFVRAWTSSGTLRAPTLKAYLFTIARHIYLQQRKRESHQIDLSPELIDENPGPDALAETRAELDAVFGALKTFPEPDRSALILRAQDGLSYDEIARICGITVAAAKVKIHRARLKLAKLLRPNQEDL